MLEHSQPLHVRFEDADPAGLIHYPRAIALAHGVVEEMIRRSALGWSAWFDDASHAAPVRHAEADFFVPLRAGELITARARVDQIGETSVTFVVEFFDPRQQLAIRVRTVQVLIDKKNGRPVPLTPAIRAALG